MARQFATMLMFEGVAEQAMSFYVSLFKGSQVTAIERYGPGESGVAGTVKRADFTLGHQRFGCIDSSVKHGFTFTASMSIYVECESDAEFASVYEQLSANGQVFMPPDNYGFSKTFAWVSDRFGVSWQLNVA
jgi:predicted 3-demethylubiquinone-9 3-methyltransferase (glyoxalase superfamily)